MLQTDTKKQTLPFLLHQHLKILLIWVLLNFLQSIPCMIYTIGKIWFFSIMNLSWAIINLLVVIWIYQHIKAKKYEKGDKNYQKKIIHHVLKVLLINILLDIGYIIIGILLLFIVVKDQLMQDLWVGFGISVIIQGIILLGLDNYFYFFQKKFKLPICFLKIKPENTINKQHKTLKIKLLK